jgi:hypothetical protein
MRERRQERKPPRQKPPRRFIDDLTVKGTTATAATVIQKAKERGANTGGATASPRPKAKAEARAKVRKAATKCEYKASNVTPNEGS